MENIKSVPDSNSQAPNEIAYNLNLSVEQRLLQHQQALDLLLELEKLRYSRESKPQSASSATSSEQN